MATTIDQAAALTASGNALNGTEKIPAAGPRTITPTQILAWIKSVASTWTGLQKFSTTGIEAYRSDDNGVVIGLSAGANDTTDSINIGAFAGQGGTDFGGTVRTPAGSQAVRVGRHAGWGSTCGNSVVIGHATAQYGWSAANGVYFGYEAARNPNLNVTFAVVGSVIMGHLAGRGSTAGASTLLSSAVLIGKSTLEYCNSGVGAVAIGHEAGMYQSSSTNTVAIGYQAGQGASGSLISCAGSVLIGKQAGKTLSRDNTLVIESNDTHAPGGVTALIYGEFDTRKLRFGADEVKFQGYAELPEISDPAAGAANTARMFCRDNGSGKSQLCVRFASGAVQVIATEP